MADDDYFRRRLEHPLHVPWWDASKEELKMRRLLRVIAPIVLALSLMSTAPAHASTDVWHGKNCTTYHSQTYDQEVCAIININDFYPTDIQALFNIPFDDGGDTITFDYVRLYRDGNNVAWHGDGTDWTINLCFGCANLSSSRWASICGTHLWDAQARFFITYDNGAVGSWKVLSTNDWQHTENC